MMKSVAKKAAPCLGAAMVLCVGLLLPVSAGALDETGFQELVELMDAARHEEADVFAPKAWRKAARCFAEAEQAIEMGKKQRDLDKFVAEGSEYTQNAVKAAEVAKLSLKEYLTPRRKAQEAKAPMLVPVLYQEAEQQFMKATEKVESGDVKGALKEADKAAPLFDAAELEAIRVEILGAGARQIEKAVAADAEKFALATLDKARSARQRANDILTADRYERDRSVAEARLAEYEARHASDIGLSVRSLKRNDQAWEKLMLVYEIQMDRVGRACGLEYLPFDNGPLAAADTTIALIEAQQAEIARLEGRLAALAGRLGEVLARLGETSTAGDPAALVEVLDGLLAGLLAERDGLSAQVAAEQAQLAELSEEHQKMSGELAIRVEREEKFRQAKQMLNPSEGEVLFNSSNDIVLRLSGLSFAVGKSDITDEHIPLLQKVESVIKMFPEAQLVVEGHTDTSGDPRANIQLSEKRAFAVMQYFRQSLLISAERIQAVGFGADRPVASNQTAEGRAKNRRIDVIIMR